MLVATLRLISKYNLQNFPMNKIYIFKVQCLLLPILGLGHLFNNTISIVSIIMFGLHKYSIIQTKMSQNVLEVLDKSLVFGYITDHKVK